jgi:hypothetical protein
LSAAGTEIVEDIALVSVMGWAEAVGAADSGGIEALPAGLRAGEDEEDAVVCSTAFVAEALADDFTAAVFLAAGAATLVAAFFLLVSAVTSCLLKYDRSSGHPVG